MSEHVSHGMGGTADGRREIDKVMVYVFSRDLERVLVFDQANSPEAGTQVPAGTIEPSERAGAAIVRELREETGITTPVEPIPFAVNVFDMAEFKDEVHVRHWYVARNDGAFPEEGWSHTERPGGGKPDIECSFYWKPVAECYDLIAGHGQLLGIAREVASESWGQADGEA